MPKDTLRTDLEAFFAACDAREKGVELNWETHLRVIEASKGSGAAEATLIDAKPSGPSDKPPG